MPEPRPCKRCGGKTELRLGRKSNGSRWPALQCLTCFEYDSGYVGVKTGYTLEMQDAAPPLDVEARNNRIQAAQREREKEWQARQQEIARQSEVWWETYSEYLMTDQWRVKRTAVLRRDNGICQACMTRPATEVHHLTYKHVGDEPLFDLVSVCSPCHAKITEMDRKKRLSMRSNPS